ncbi:MAG: phage tail sheath family protein [Marinisporobacter sp.]|jgi:phage tail sheath protein FI|nr:phage tail sheath family protein [Marinisporobacter sp.]
MAEYLSPGVYVEEFDSGPVPMEGVSTSTAGFIGMAERGDVQGQPVLITNFSEFLRNFGGYLSQNEYGDYRYLAYGVEHFFINGGSRCYVMRVAPEDAKCSVSKKCSNVVQFTAKNPGMWGNGIRVSVYPSSKAKTPILEVVGEKSYRVKSNAGFNPGDIVRFVDGDTVITNKVVTAQDNIIEFENAFEEDVVDKNLLPKKFIITCEIDVEVKYSDTIETYEKVSFNIQAPNYIEKKMIKSDLVQTKYIGKIEPSMEDEVAVEGILTPFAMFGKEESESVTISLESGSNGSVSSMAASDFMGKDLGPGKRSGLQAFVDNDQVSIMAIPGIVDPNVQLALVAHCENLKSRFAILDVPREEKKVPDVLAHRDMFDTQYAAMYHPWLEVFDPLDKRTIAVPPSASMAGIYSRSDLSRGVHKAPANEVVRACTGLDCQYSTGEQDILNPKGVNLIRSFTGRGIRVWGARTCSSNGLWKYINVRRLFIFLEESIKRNTDWVVFEPNDEMLWARVNRTIELFLSTVWRSGALAGTTASDAFFVNIGRSTMTQDDIDNGRLICVIGVAPVKPAEFVIFRITQKTAESGE